MKTHQVLTLAAMARSHKHLVQRVNDIQAASRGIRVDSLERHGGRDQERLSAEGESGAEA